MSQDATTIAIGQKKGLVTIKEANTRNIILNIKVGEDHFDLSENSIYSLLYSACKTYLAVGVKVEGPEDKIYQRVLVYKIDYQQKVAKLHKDFKEFYIKERCQIVFGSINDQCLLAVANNKAEIPVQNDEGEISILTNQGQVTITNLTQENDVTTRFSTGYFHNSILLFDERSGKLISADKKWSLSFL